MKKSFEESIQWMREQNWIKLWLKSLGYSSLDNADLLASMRRRYDVMDRDNVGCSIIIGVQGGFCFEGNTSCEYAQSVRKAMHKWMFNY